MRLLQPTPPTCVVDLFGSFGPSAGWRSTRSRPTASSTPATARPATRKSGSSVRAPSPLPVAGVGPVPAGAQAVLVNVTAVDPTASGYVTVHPCGTAPWVVERQLPGRPDRGQPGRGRARRLGHRSASPPTSRPTSWSTSWAGWATPACGCGPRHPSGSWTPAPATGRRSARSRPAAWHRSPCRRNGMLGTVTAVTPSGPGYLTVYPCPARPTASNLNYVAGDIVPNLVAIPPGRGWSGLHLHAGDRPTSSSTARPPSSPDARRPRRSSCAAGTGRHAVSRSCPCADGRGPAPPPGRRRARPSPGAGRPCGGPGPGPARPWPARP